MSARLPRLAGDGLEEAKARLERCSTVRLAAAAAVVALASCLAIPGGLLDSGWPGDVIYYSHVGHRVAQGEIPYHEFYLEYPPGAVPAFALPALVSQSHYVLVFKLLMALCAAGAAAAGAAVVGRLSLEASVRLRAVLGLGLAPLLLGPLFLNRYDVWAAFAVSLALLALVAGRGRLALGLLAFGVVAKIYAVAALPVAAVHLARTRGRSELLRALAVFAAVGLACILPFAAVGFGGLGYSFYIQATRHLQVESLGAQALVALHHLGLYRTHVAIGDPGSVDLFGSLASGVGVLSAVVEVAAVVAVALWYRRGSTDGSRLVLAWAASIAAFVAFGKVLSPQYVVWLIPLVPLVDLGVGAAALTLLGAVLLMTQLAFYDSEGVANLGPVSWMVLARNLLLVGLFGLLGRPLLRGARP